MRKGLGSVYNKWNISVVICDTYSIAVNQVMVATVKLSSVQLLVAETYIGMEQSQVIIVHLLAFFYQDVNIVLYTIVYLLEYLK
jgi:hypothetical protein